jgi:hypothetical protein
MEASVHNLLTRLIRGPAMLLLGQAIELPREVPGEREDRAPETPPIAGSADGVAAYQAFDALIRAAPRPSWLQETTQYHWNGVFTSRFDSVLVGSFSSDWRRVVATAQAQIGRHPRSSTEPQVRHLFGGVALPEDERPATDISELWPRPAIPS